MDIDSLYRRLVKEAEGKDTGQEKRLEIRKELTIIRRMKKEAETRRNVHIGWGDAKLSPLEYITMHLEIGVFLLL